MTVFERTLKSIADETERLRERLHANPSIADASAIESQIRTQEHCHDFVEYLQSKGTNAADISRMTEKVAERGRISAGHAELDEIALEAIDQHSKKIRFELDRLEERIE